MTREKFDEIVQELTVAAKRNPKAYQAKVALLAAGGYAYLLLVLLFAFALLAALCAAGLGGHGVVLVVKVGWLILLFVWAILSAMWVRLPVPVGHRLSRTEAPALFAVLDRFRGELGAPEFHEVVVNAEFNAAVVQVPRLGIFGWHRNYLLLGLPFMEAMPAAEFESVIAHEYGHLASGHARFSNWIYRQRVMWGRIAEQMAAQNQGGWLIAPFLRRFIPYFNAYSFVLARGNEYEADRASVRLMGAQTVANALLRSEIMGQYLTERVYASYYRLSWHQPAPAVPISRFLREKLDTGPSVGDVSRWTVRASARLTDSVDTHPAFCDRVAAVGVPPDLQAGPVVAAARVLLGEELVVRLRQDHDQEWENANRDAWKERFENSEKGRARLVELQKDKEWSQLPWDQAWEQAALIEKLRTEQDALPCYEDLLKRDARHAGAAFNAGRLRLAGGDATGAELVERAMRLDWRWIIAGCDLLYGYQLEQGDTVAAAVTLRRYREQQDKLQLAQEERARLERGLAGEPHGLDAKPLAALTEQIWAVKSVARAWLVRKQLNHFPDEPMFIVGYQVPWYHLHTQGYYDNLSRRIADGLTLPGQYVVVSFDSGFGWLGKKVKNIPGALIFTRR